MAKLSDYYKAAPLDPPTVVKTEKPKAGVTIKRDAFNVPYVYGTTDDNTAWGAGYAGTEDRMFVMDAIRYAGAARMSELLGPTKANLQSDADQLRQADYTPAEENAQLDALAKLSPDGKELLRRLDAYVDGVNTARRKLCPTVKAKSCPVVYGLLGVTPTPYTRADVVSAAALVGGIFGKGGGQEAQNAVFLRKLSASIGDAMARKVLNDLADPTDPSTPVTDPGKQPYGTPGTIDPAAVALPDLVKASQLVPATGGSVPTSKLSGAGAGGGENIADRLQLPPEMSNALLVSGDHTTTGRPIAVMGPQTAYQAPNFFDEIALHGPHYQARGVAFANLQFTVLIGHGRSYAWSATSSSGDIVDTVLDKLCNADGSKATVNSTGYLDGDTCTSMKRPDHVLHDKAGAGSKVIATFPDFRTRHGIVQYRTTSGGIPVAVVLQRSTYGHEPDSVLGFAKMNDPTAIHSARDFTDAFSKVGFTFNWFYVDTRDIASFTSGDLPIRAKGVDPDLPRWGDAKWDWTGFIPAKEHPQSIDPPQGYLVSWNNKPTVGTYAADDTWGWGPVQRVLALRDRVEQSIKLGKLSRATLTADMMGAATVDIRGAYLLKDMLAVVGDDPKLASYTKLLQRWMNGGAHRVDRARTGHYADQNAIALMDAWYPLVAKAVLQPRLGSLVDAVPTDFDNAPSTKNRGSAWNNVGAYSWISRDLGAVLGQPVGQKMSQGYCGKGVLADCRTEIRQTLTDAVATLTKAQHTSDPAKWTYDKSRDDIKFMFVGESVKPIDWQNRSTFQHGHRLIHALSAALFRLTAESDAVTVIGDQAGSGSCHLDLMAHRSEYAVEAEGPDAGTARVCGMHVLRDGISVRLPHRTPRRVRRILGHHEGERSMTRPDYPRGRPPSPVRPRSHLDGTDGFVRQHRGLQEHVQPRHDAGCADRAQDPTHSRATVRCDPAGVSAHQPVHTRGRSGPRAAGSAARRDVRCCSRWPGRWGSWRCSRRWRCGRTSARGDRSLWSVRPGAHTGPHAAQPLLARDRRRDRPGSVRVHGAPLERPGAAHAGDVQPAGLLLRLRCRRRALATGDQHLGRRHPGLGGMGGERRPDEPQAPKGVLRGLVGRCRRVAQRRVRPALRRGAGQPDHRRA